MKLKSSLLLVGVGLLLASCSSSGFDATKNVVLYTRDATSGTRECFFENIGYSDVKSADNWEPGVNPTNAVSSQAMLSSIKNDQYGIGYASLDGLSKSSGLIGLSFNGVTASESTVLDGSYKLSRNFNYVIRDYSDATSTTAIAANAFAAYMGTVEGRAVIQEAGGILVNSTNTPTWDSIKGQYNFGTNKITLKTCGSTSVLDVLNALTSAFTEATNDVVSFSSNQTGSGSAKTGVTAAVGSTDYADIGFLSRELDDADNAAFAGTNITSHVMCKDAVVAIINADNTSIKNATGDLLTAIYKGQLKTWQDVIDASK